MSYSASDLQLDVDRLLDRLCLEVTGEDEDGFTVRRGDSVLTTNQGTFFNSAAEASAAALEGLFDNVEDLLSAAKEVINCWDKGDLAAAVRELVVCVRVIDESAPGQVAEEKTVDRLKTRLGHLVRSGLQFGDCVAAFGATESQDHAVAQARRLFHDAGDIEIDTTTVVSRDEGYGAYVMAWVHVPDTKPADEHVG